MSLTNHQIALVQHSMRQLTDRLEPGDTRFYDNLFRIRPDLRTMFRDDLAGQGMKFMTTLALIADALITPAVLESELTPLAQGHAALGVEPDFYAPLGEALIATFHEILGDAFTSEVETAWRAAYDDIAARMIAAGGPPA